MVDDACGPDEKVQGKDSVVMLDIVVSRGQLIAQTSIRVSGLCASHKKSMSRPHVVRLPVRRGRWRPLDNGHLQLRWVASVVVHRIVRDDTASAHAKRFASVRVHVESRKVAA